MKKNLCLSLFCILSSMVTAQDVLVTESGDAIKAWSVDIGGTKIYYRTSADANAPLQSIDKSAVLVWKKADGSRVVIGQEEKKTTETPAAKKEPVMLDADDPEANEACIQAFNQTDAYSNKTPSKKTASSVLCLLHMMPDSKMADKNVEISYTFYRENLVPKGIGVHVRNKTDKTIYVYLGNTFFLRHGISTPFTQSQASQSTSNGNNGTVSTGFSQNVIAIPAQSTLDLGRQYFFPQDGKNPFGGNITNSMQNANVSGRISAYSSLLKTGSSQVCHFYWTGYKSDLLTRGEVRELAPGGCPIDFGCKLTYSFSEDNTQLYHLDTKLYVSKIIGYTGPDIELIGQPAYLVITQKEIK